MAKDPYLKGARAQFEALRASRAQALAELEAHKQGGDKYLMGEAIQRLADINAAEQNLTALANQYLASQQAPPELSPEEKAAKPIERMSLVDAYELARSGSKYGIDDASFRRGVEEVARRRARGE